MWCVYLTIYKGNKLPPFYIGYTKTQKIIEKKYFGSVSSEKYKQLWKKELKENKQLFSSRILKEFEIKSQALEYEEYIHRKFNVHINELYVNRSIGNRKFVNKTHRFGFKLSEETKRKIIRCGIENGMYGKKHSEETKLKISELSKARHPHKQGLTLEHRRKISESHKGKKLSQEHIEKMRKSKIGKKLSEEHVKKVKDALTGRKCTPEHIEKVRQSKLGKKLINGKFVCVEW